MTTSSISASRRLVRRAALLSPAAIGAHVINRTELDRVIATYAGYNKRRQGGQGRDVCEAAYRWGYRIVVTSTGAQTTGLVGVAAAARIHGAEHGSHRQPRTAAGCRVGSSGPGQFISYDQITQPAG